MTPFSEGSTVIRTNYSDNNINRHILVGNRFKIVRIIFIKIYHIFVKNKGYTRTHKNLKITDTKNWTKRKKSKLLLTKF